jgi:hypothetical protein
MKSTFFTLGICLVLWGCSCKKENNEPEQKKPDPTTDGRNTFYCEINGVPYYQKFVGGQPDFPRITGSYSKLDTLHALDLRFSFINKDIDQNISIFVTEPDVSKSILFKSKFRSHAFFRDSKKGCNFSSSIIDFGTFSGSLNFTRFDPNSSIFSGTFEFKNWLPDSVKGGCDTVKVTNGIFDLKL